MDAREEVTEITLDPEDWGALRELGHQMLDDMLSYLETLRERPVWQPMPDEVRASFRQPLPVEGEGEAAAYQNFLQTVQPYPLGNIHPRFWGWVIGTGTPFAMLAEMLAAGMNPNLGGGDHAANDVEQQVIEWCKQMLGYPAEASGLLVSGGSMANLVGLAVARNARAEIDVRQDGVRAAPREMVLYASRETHSSNPRAAELLGLGHAALRLVPVNDDFEIDIAALEAMIATDRAAGRHPFCVIGHAGTVNTGASDDLNALADICEREGLWFHVDGAFGALAAISPELAPRVVGMERADSVAFDMHKWMYLPIEVGCVLVRDQAAHLSTFSVTPDYLAHGTRGAHAGGPWFSEYGLQLSRSFRALKVWMSFKAHGLDTFRRLIEQNVAQARYLARLVDDEPELERLAPVPLNIVCFRYNPGRLDDEKLNELNEELLVRLHESGAVLPSYTRLNGNYVIRAAITNHRSRREDFEVLVQEVLRLGRGLRDGSHG